MERRLRLWVKLLICQCFLIGWYGLIEAVEFPPSFSQKPSGLVVPDGTRASLNCSATGNPPPSYEWLTGVMNRVRVVSDRRRYVTPDGNLVFNPFNSSLDEGVYYCTATNSLSTITSEGVLLNVARFPTVKHGPRNVTVGEKEDVIFTCAGDGFPSPDYLWRRDYDASFRQEGASLRLHAVSPSDAGEYRCEVFNVAGRATAEAFLHVQYAPSALVSPSQTVAHHETPTLTCNFKGYPTVTVQWRKDGQILERHHAMINTVITTPMIGEGISQLTLKNLHKQDSGTYSCEVVNELGRDVGEVQLLVQFPPDPPILQPAVLDGTTVNLTWSLAHPSPSPPVSSSLILYRHQDQPLKKRNEKLVPGADARRASVAGLKKGKTYYFQVVSQNSVGQSGLSNVVTAVIAATVPDAAVLLSAISLSSRSIQLKWMQPAGSNGGSLITKYGIEYRAIGATEWTTTVVESDVSETAVLGLFSNTSYIFRVLAMNAVGFSQHSNSKEAKTDVLGSPSIVNDVDVNSSDETSATVSWAIPDKSLEENQDIQKYIIHLSAGDDVEHREVVAPFETEGNRVLFELGNLLPNVTYHIAVAAVNKHIQGAGLQSSSVSFTTQARADVNTGIDDSDSPKSIVEDNAAYIAGGIAGIVVFSACIVVVIVWRCHVSGNDSSSSTASMKSDLESHTAMLPPYSPAKKQNNMCSKPLPDPCISAVRDTFEQALTPTPSPGPTVADLDVVFSSIGIDTLGEEQIPSNIGSPVNSMYDEHPDFQVNTGTVHSRSLSAERVSQLSDEIRKKKMVTFGSPHDVSPVRPNPSSPTRSLPSNSCYSQRGIRLDDIEVELNSYV